MLTKVKATPYLIKDKHIHLSYYSLSESDSARVDPSYKRNIDDLPNGT